MASVDCPFLLSFVLHSNGCLLDGTPVAEAIERIDQSAPRRTTAYLANCIHPVHFEKAMSEAEKSHPGIRERLIGLQGNTSRKSPADFDASLELDSEDPKEFGMAMARLRSRFGTQVLGGCCGTDARHIEAIAHLCCQVS
jgi:homocysteine S-methyltransferase